MSDPDSICQVTVATPTPSPSSSSSEHKITFINNCSTESIWIAAYDGFNGDAPLLCDPINAGKAVTGFWFSSFITSFLSSDHAFLSTSLSFFPALVVM